jgi:hypothetical protein
VEFPPVARGGKSDFPATLEVAMNKKLLIGLLLLGLLAFAGCPAEDAPSGTPAGGDATAAGGDGEGGGE